MKNLLDALILGKGIEKIKIITTTYLILMCVIFTNIIMNLLHYCYTKTSINYSITEIMDFIFSKECFLVVTIFAINFTFVFFWGRMVFVPFAVFIGIKILKYGFAILLFLLGFMILLITLQFKKIKKASERLKRFLNFASIENIEFRNFLVWGVTSNVDGNKFGKLLKKVQFTVYNHGKDIIKLDSLQKREDSDTLENVLTILYILVSIYLIFEWYDVLKTSMPKIWICVKIITWYWAANSTYVIWIFKNIEFMKDMIIDIELINIRKIN